MPTPMSPIYFEGVGTGRRVPNKSHRYTFVVYIWPPLCVSVTFLTIREKINLKVRSVMEITYNR